MVLVGLGGGIREKTVNVLGREGVDGEADCDSGERARGGRCHTLGLPAFGGDRAGLRCTQKA